MNFGKFYRFVVSYLIGGLIGYYAAEMLLRKPSVFLNNKGFIAFALIIVLLLESILISSVMRPTFLTPGTWR